ncbi:murein L,D-transpeptidase, partial [Salmonella enterica subsp. enterica serovar Enteritidis]|nr:murein L,D-transpeptidase [Salmonella enterica subsp. enterica serovar Enteritidis]
MRDCLNHRRGFDRVLMSVAATFLAVSAGAALAQDQGRSNAAELAIEAAIPRPEPANVPPPTAADIKLDTTATVQDSAKETAKAEAAPAPGKVETKPSDVATTPAP